MTEGITCYERDEALCVDPICVGNGCRIRTSIYPPIPEKDLKNCHSYVVDRVTVTKHHVYGRFENGSWTVIKVPEPDWQPIDTAPIPASTEINPRTYIFRCLIQNRRDEVSEGEAHYVQVSRKSENWVLRWYIGHGRKLCNPQPIYWMPMPAAKVTETSIDR